MSQRRRGGGVRGLALGVSLLVVVAMLATGLVWTNTLGAAERFSGLVARVRVIVAPPPDREIVDVVLIAEESFAPETPAPTPTPPPTRRPAGTADPAAAPEPTPEPRPTPTPLPPRRKVDVQLRVAREALFSSQVDNTMCASAAIQMVLNMHGVGPRSDAFQQEIDGRLGRWESRRDAKAGGWGPAAMASALEEYGVTGYELRAYRGRSFAIRDAARIISDTGAPVILIAWRGAHAWVMTGYRADADPTVFKDAEVTGAYIYDPWYPRVSSIWGPSDGPGVFQDEAEMVRNFLPWQRPEGAYPDRDGLFIIVAPTIPMREARERLGT